MTYPKLLGIITAFLFATIAVLAFFKNGKTPAPKNTAKITVSAPIEVELEKEVRVVQSSVRTKPAAKVATASPSSTQMSKPIAEKLAAEKSIIEKTVTETPVASAGAPTKKVDTEPLPDANRIQELFNKGDPKLPIVETITYKSRVPWQKGRPAWLSDYASYYSTSRHFIARSLNGKPDYFKQDVAEGDRFNVLRKDKNIKFHLLIDVTRSRMWFYYVDLDTKEKVLLKTYPVGLGRVDTSKTSGLLTPLGKYSLGDKIAIYKPKMMGHYNGQKVEMVRIFGSRWIPFDKELSGTTAPAKGFGLHGVPWVAGTNGALAQDTSSLGKYESDGCIRLASADIEEIFAIVITKPTTIELVKDFHDSDLTVADK